MSASVDLPIHVDVASLVAAEPGLDVSLQRHLRRPLRFRSPRHRDEHLRKHVLDAREERWHQVLDADLVSAVRNTPSDADIFERLAVAYETELERAFEEAIREPGRAVGLVRFEVLPPRPELGPNAAREATIGGFRAERRSIIAWCPRRRLRIIAGFPVSQAGAAAYRLLSGFRHDLRGSGGRFVRAVRERILDRVERSQERLVDPLPDEQAIHLGQRSPEHP